MFAITLKSILVGSAIALAALAITTAAVWRQAGPGRGLPAAIAERARGAATDRFPEPSPELSAKVEAFCGDCHAVPSPASFARDRWPEEIKRGYEFYARSRRNDLDPPAPHVTLAYYLSRSPVEVEFEQAPEATTPLETKFRVERRTVPAEATLPEVSTLIWTPLQEGGRPMLVATDMKFGQVVAMDPTDAAAPPIILARLEHPARIRPVQFSDDGSTEFLVADMGSYMPTEEKRGSVVLLHRPSGGSAFETTTLASDFTRVADVQAADVDGDGKLDLLVSEFGWQRTGGTWLLRNVTEGDQSLQFEREMLDDRPGAINLPVHDFDGDGHPDFAALVGQEYEAVDLFLNRMQRDPAAMMGGRNPFLRLGVWAGPDLTFGSSSLALTDLNQNGRIDLLVTNGDTWDNLLAAPTHGVHWLENQGDLEFRHRRLAMLPGAYATTVFDVDGDGDLDIVAVAWLPRNVEPETVTGGKLGSIICLEQVEPGRFERHTLETGSPFYSTVVSGDFDGDDDIDFAVASGPMVAGDREEKFYLAIWWNQTVPNANP